MKNKQQYLSGKEPNTVMCDSRGEGILTYVLRETEYPPDPWKIAHLLNDAYARGYAAAQADIRSSLGIR